MTIIREERIGGQRLILGDCREIIGGLTFDAIVSDVPYGIGYARGAGGKGKAGHHNKHDGKPIVGDDQPFDPEPFLQWPCILWGANHYAARLPHGRWLAWDKLGGQQPFGDDFSDVEFAWQNKRGGSHFLAPLEGHDYRQRKGNAPRPSNSEAGCADGVVPVVRAGCSNHP